MAIVWPCALSVDAYASAGTKVDVPRPRCPECTASMCFWWGYWRDVREGGRCLRVFVRRAACRACRVTHALWPSFLLLGRLDAAATIGTAIEEVADGKSGARPAAERAEVTHATARGWLRRFGRRAGELAVAFAALAVELGGEVVEASGRAMLDAVVALRAAGILVGQPTLSRQLWMGMFAALDQRIATRFSVKAMDLAESAGYLRHHLRLAGRDEPLFADDAVARLHRVSNGLPRALNNAGTAALVAAAAEGKDLVDDACAKKAAAELTRD